MPARRALRQAIDRRACFTLDTSSERVGDVEVKMRLVDALNSLMSSIRQRRRELLAANPSIVEDVLRSGAKQAWIEAGKTIRQVRAAMQIDSLE